MSYGTVVGKLKKNDGDNWLIYHMNTRYHRTHDTIGSDYILL